MEPKLKNWDNFCRYHAIGDWHGIWTKYSPEGEVTESFRGIRSFQTSLDGSEVYHHNHYIYADGRSESQTFQTKKKPITLSLFLDHSFSWGSTNRESDLKGEKFGYKYLDAWKWASFFFETGFSCKDRKASAGAVYDQSANLQQIVVITEHLGKFVEESPLPPENERFADCQGTLKTMTPDWIVSPAQTTPWKRLEDLASDYLTLHLNDGISVSCPRNIESGKELFVAVDWLANPALLQRGIRHYDRSGLTKFSLEVYSSR